MDARALARLARRTAVLAAAALLAACGGDPTPDATKTSLPEDIVVFSDVFRDGGRIPSPYACPRDLSPPIEWAEIPSDAIELALTVIDPDARGGAFVHWVAFGIPPDVTGFEPGTVPPGVKQATNDFGKVGYGGPCPPSGEQHRYVFMVSALSARVAQRDGAPAADVLEAVADLTLDRGLMIGLYG